MRISDWSSDVCSSDLRNFLIMSPAMTNRLTPALIAAVLALPLAGCLGLSGPKPPPTLFTLSAPEMAELPSRSATSGAATTVVVPHVQVAPIGRGSVRGRRGPYEYISVDGVLYIKNNY